LINFLVFAILTGPVSEEFGWRGYALPRLQSRRKVFRAAVIVGLLWGFWHTGTDFWRMVFAGDARALFFPLTMTMGTIPLSVMLAWMFNRAGGSLLPGMMFHASFNSTLYVLSLIWLRHSALLTGTELILGTWIVAIVVAVNDPLMDRVG
jgi:membrane protease YdiL (CAAX protease family)